MNYDANSPVVLIAEDNQDTAENIRLYLTHHHMNCVMAKNGLQALDQFQQCRPHLVLLDWMMPKLDGLQVCAQIRHQSDVPIIMLTAKVSSDDLVSGLEAGADEYVKKPFEHKELLARIRAHLRRVQVDSDNSKEILLGPWRYNIDCQSVSFQDNKLTLTKTEFKLLMQLIQSPGRVFTREQLFLSVFNHDSDSSDRTVDVHLHNVRKKITAVDGQNHGIRAVYGIGYRLDLL